jgi:DNA-directed RNA polymerase specialized sigma24 family protein
VDDEELIAATARGDADAALYRRHLPLVVSYVMRATGDPEVAADLTAEVFAAARLSVRSETED